MKNDFRILTLYVFAFTVICIIPVSEIFAQFTNLTSNYQENTLQNIPSIDKKFIRDTIFENGDTIVGVVVPGKPPEGFHGEIAEYTESSVTLENSPAYDWSFGCSATAAAMMAGFYDNVGYENMYTGPTNGGVAPMDNSVWGSVVINGETRKQCPISATRNGLDGRTTRGHVDDYWIQYGNCNPDPYITNGWQQHTYEGCTGDFMKTNQSAFSNCDAATTFWYNSNGYPYTGSGNNGADGGYGLELFFESRGYQVLDRYTQLVYGYNGNSNGFTFNDFKQEIDNGRPVMIHIVGHSMVGYGYDESGNTIYIHDTWDYSDHQMTWGGSYSGMQHWGVTVVELEEMAPPPNCEISTGGIQSHDFGMITVGDCSSTFDVEITSIGNSVATGNVSLTGNNPGQYQIVAGGGNFSLEPGSSKTVEIQFCPISSGEKNADLFIESSCNNITFQLNGSAYQDPVIMTIPDDIMGSPGDTDVSVPIMMDNQINSNGSVSSIQTTLSYDASIGISLDENSFVLTDRIDGFSISLNVSENGENSTVNIQIFNATGGTIPEGTGSIIDLLFDISSNALTGVTTPICFNDCIIFDPQSNQIPVDFNDCGYIEIEQECTPGDLNCDGELNILDLQELIDCILLWGGNCDESFDLNGDSTINIMDLQLLINLILDQ